MRFIYGLYDRAGNCLYVGNSARPKSRMQGHARKNNLAFGRRCIDYFCGMVLREVHRSSNSVIIEWQVIRAYQRKNQCAFNSTGFHPGRAGSAEALLTVNEPQPLCEPQPLYAHIGTRNRYIAALARASYLAKQASCQ